jgi:hypothetical protein
MTLLWSSPGPVVDNLEKNVPNLEKGPAPGVGHRSEQEAPAK